MTFLPAGSFDLVPRKVRIRKNQSLDWPPKIGEVLMPEYYWILDRDVCGHEWQALVNEAHHEETCPECGSVLTMDGEDVLQQTDTHWREKCPR